MPQSLSRLHIHLIFSTKHREPWITDAVRPELHAYMAQILKAHRCTPVLINSVEDHVHLLIDLARTVTVSKVVEDLKVDSSKWIKTQGPEFAGFAWQGGYGAFAISEVHLNRVGTYIARQQEHHRTESFQDECRALFQSEGIAYDERYVWD